jgi:mono/diheme cytochrome c family protein
MRVAIAPLLLFSCRAAASSVQLDVDPTPAPAELSTPVSAEAKALFEQRCALCHGSAGRADGQMSARLNPRPPNFSVALWQEKTSDAHIRKIVVDGGGAVGKSPMMPPAPDLKDKTTLVDALVRVVRGFRRSVVVATLVGDEKATTKSARRIAEPGKPTSLRFDGIAPGTYALRGFVDDDGDGARDDGEATFAVASIVVPAEGARATVHLDPGTALKAEPKKE